MEHQEQNSAASPRDGHAESGVEDEGDFVSDSEGTPALAMRRQEASDEGDDDQEVMNSSERRQEDDQELLNSSQRRPSFSDEDLEDEGAPPPNDDEEEDDDEDDGEEFGHEIDSRILMDAMEDDGDCQVPEHPTQAMETARGAKTKAGDTRKSDGGIKELGMEERKDAEAVAVPTAAGACHMHDDRNQYSNEVRPSSFIEVDLSEIRKDVQCPICLGIIRKTRTVMECLHRFCRECIDKSMRLGNNECPVCRTHCASRRSLRDDVNFDALISALYPNVDSYEEEEFALREEEELKNKQLQASIAETSERQSEAITRRYSTAKPTAPTFARKPHSKSQSIHGQNKERSQGSDHGFGGDDEESTEQYGQTPPEVASREKRPRRRKRETSFPADEDQGESQVNKPSRHTSSKTGEAKGEVISANAAKGDGLATWARAGARSSNYMRYGNSSSANNRLVARATVLYEALAAAAKLENDAKFDIHFALQPFNQGDPFDTLPTLEKPYLCCPANVTVQHMLKFLVGRLPYAPAGELELVVMSSDWQSDLRVDSKSIQRQKGKSTNDGDTCKNAEILHPQCTLGQIYTYFWRCHGNLVIMYRQKN